MVHIAEHPHQQKNQQTPYFVEVQRFRQTWIWVLLGALLGTLLFLGGFQIIQQRTSGIHWLSTSSLFLMGGIWLVLALLAYKAHLFTQINETGIHFQLFPFHFTVQRITWGDIEEMYVRDYDALSEYGGWGLKYGQEGKAYTISGRYGVQLQLADEQRILIGTQRPIELEKLILQLRYDYDM
uniref:Uncharacterized protein n=1 Tax=Roseihalotalea indica TaxID=2867963 RepID=A0AA49JJP4_9BACT|nr:hypothetical protein K4G66_14485 [Tunicatimonas sp. TK19036]